MPKPKPTPEDDDEGNENLPVSPDEGAPLVPDEEGDVNVPS